MDDRSESRDKILELIERKILVALSGIGPTSGASSDRDESEAVVNLIKARASLLTEAELMGDKA